MQQGSGFGVTESVHHICPLVEQVLKVIFQGYFVLAVGNGTNNNTETIRQHGTECTAQSAAFPETAYPLRYGYVVAHGNEHEQAAGQGDVGGNPWAFVADGFLYDLHEHFLLGLQQRSEQVLFLGGGAPGAVVVAIGRQLFSEIFNRFEGILFQGVASVEQSKVIVKMLAKIGKVKEGVFRGSHIDEGCPDAAHHLVYFCYIYVADTAPVFRGFYEKLS